MNNQTLIIAVIISALFSSGCEEKPYIDTYPSISARMIEAEKKTGYKSVGIIAEIYTGEDSQYGPQPDQPRYRVVLSLAPREYMFFYHEYLENVELRIADLNLKYMKNHSLIREDRIGKLSWMDYDTKPMTLE